MSAIEKLGTLAEEIGVISIRCHSGKWRVWCSAGLFDSESAPNHFTTLEGAAGYVLDQLHVHAKKLLAQ